MEKIKFTDAELNSIKSKIRQINVTSKEISVFFYNDFKIEIKIKRKFFRKVYYPILIVGYCSRRNTYIIENTEDLVRICLEVNEKFEAERKKAADAICNEDLNNLRKTLNGEYQ